MSEQVPQFDPLTEARSRADVGRQIYDEFMEKNIDPSLTVQERAQGHADLGDFLENRPNSATDRNNVVGFGGVEDLAHYNDTLEANKIENNSLGELVGMWAEADDISDKTKSQDVQDEIERRLLKEGAMSDDHRLSLIDRLYNQKEALRKTKTEDTTNTESFGDKFRKPMRSAEKAKIKGDWNDYQKSMLDMADIADEHEIATGEPISDEFVKHVDKRLDSVQDGRIERVDTSNTLDDQEPDVVVEAPLTRRQRIRRAWDRAVVKLANPIIMTKTGNKLRGITTVEDENGERHFKKGAKVAAIIGGIAVAAGGAYLISRGLSNGNGRNANEVANHGPRGGGPNKVADIIAVKNPKGSASEQLSALVSGRSKEVLDASGKYPWNKAASLYGSSNATPRLMSAVEKLRASGANVQWHGGPATSHSAWLSIDGVSDSNAVWSRLSRTLAEDDIQKFFSSIA